MAISPSASSSSLVMQICTTAVRTAQLTRDSREELELGFRLGFGFKFGFEFGFGIGLVSIAGSLITKFTKNHISHPRNRPLNTVSPMRSPTANAMLLQVFFAQCWWRVAGGLCCWYSVECLLFEIVVRGPLILRLATFLVSLWLKLNRPMGHWEQV